MSEGWRRGILMASGRRLAPAGSAPSTPSNVSAVQGPTDPTNLYAWVTWTRNDITATSYKVYRDASLIATVTVAGDTWDKCAYKDTAVTGGSTHVYTVTASNGVDSQASTSVPLLIRRNHASNVYVPSTNTEAAIETALAAADAAALQAGYEVKVVELAASTTYTITSSLGFNVGKNVVLRGHKNGTTKIKNTAALANWMINTDPVSGWTQVGNLTADAAVGATTITVASATNYTVGRMYYIEQFVSDTLTNMPGLDGVLMDPAGDLSDHYTFDMFTVAAVNGTTITLEQPLQTVVRVANRGTRPEAQVWRVPDNSGCGIEQVQIEGASVTETAAAEGLYVYGRAGFHVAECVFKWWQARSIRTRAAGAVNVVGCTISEGGPDMGASTSNRYMCQLFEAPRSRVIANTFSVVGGSGNFRSLLELDSSNGTWVRHNTFGYSRSYAVNPGHGSLLRYWTVENNRIATGHTGSFPEAGDDFAMVVVGHNGFGFDGPGIVRNNQFEGSGCCMELEENAYGTLFLDNKWISPIAGTFWTTPRMVDLYGWDGPDTAAGGEGSMRLTVGRNAISGTIPGGTELIRARVSIGAWTTTVTRDIVLEGNTGVTETITTSGTLERAPYDTSAGYPAWSTDLTVSPGGGAGVPTAYTGLQLWLDASQHSATNGDPVSTASDYSGNARHFTQSGDARQAYRTAQINGDAAFDFDGTDDYMVGPVLSSVISASAYTVIGVVLIDAIVSDNSNPYNNEAVWADSTAYAGGHVKATGALFQGYNYDGTTDVDTFGITLGTAFVFMQRHQGGNLYLSKNGGSESSVASGDTSVLTGNLQVGAGSTAAYLNGKLGEIAVWNVALTGTEIGEIITQMEAKWGI